MPEQQAVRTRLARSWLALDFGMRDSMPGIRYFHCLPHARMRRRSRSIALNPERPWALGTAIIGKDEHQLVVLDDVLTATLQLVIPTSHPERYRGLTGGGSSWTLND